MDANTHDLVRIGLLVQQGITEVLPHTGCKGEYHSTGCREVLKTNQRMGGSKANKRQVVFCTQKVYGGTNRDRKQKSGAKRGMVNHVAGCNVAHRAN